MKSILILLVAFTACTNAPQTNSSTVEPWILLEDESTEKASYRTVDGKVMIPADTYTMMLTDTFRTYAIVLTKEDYRFILIDRKQKEQYEIFRYDNGPDYPSDGLFRIIQNGKIGYADATTFEVVIAPQFDCAFPFENGKAKVSKNCKKIQVGEHQEWVSEDWELVDREGNF